MRLKFKIAAATAKILFASTAFAQDIKIALIAGKTGPLEAYAKQTEAGFMMGLEYLTKGTMTINGRKISSNILDTKVFEDGARALVDTLAVAKTLGHGGSCGPMKRSDDGGKTWGDHGYGYLPYAFFASPDLTWDFWTMRKVS